MEDDNARTLLLECSLAVGRTVTVALDYEEGHALDVVTVLYELGSPGALEDLLLTLRGDPSVDMAIQLGELIGDDDDDDASTT